MRKRKKLALLLAIAGCILLIYLCTVLGAASISPGETNRILLREIFHIPVDLEGISQGSIAIIRDVRLPRVLLGFLTGAALAVCGSSYQGIFKNPMADPYILGISSGAALGAAIGIVLNASGNIAGLSGTTMLAFAGALLTVFLVYTISRTGRKVPIASLILSGIAVNQSLSAFMSLIMLFNQQSMDQIMFWTMGSLNGKGWTQILIILPYVVLGIFLLMTSARELDIMLLGEDTSPLAPEISAPSDVLSTEAPSVFPSWGEDPQPAAAAARTKAETAARMFLFIIKLLFSLIFYSLRMLLPSEALQHFFYKRPDQLPDGVPRVRDPGQLHGFRLFFRSGGVGINAE